MSNQGASADKGQKDSKDKEGINEEDLKVTDSEEGEEENDEESAGEGAAVTSGAHDCSLESAEPPVDRPAEDLLPEQVTLAALRNYTDGEVKEVEVKHLRWDFAQEWGQIRPLNPSLVEQYLQRLQANAPRIPVRVLLRNMGAGMHSYAESARCLNFVSSQMIATQSLVGNTLQLQSSGCT